MTAREIADEIRRRLGPERAACPSELLVEIERLVAERPRTSARVRVAIERELLLMQAA